MTEIQKKKAEWLRRPHYIRLQIGISDNPKADEELYNKTMAEITEALSKIENPLYRSLLRVSFVENLTVEDISKKINYSKRATMNLRIKALDMLSDDVLIKKAE